MFNGSHVALHNNISQGSVATHFRCGEIFSDGIIDNFLLILTETISIENQLIFDKFKAFKKLCQFLGHPV